MKKAGKFYGAVLTPLGLLRRQVTPDGGPAALCWAAHNDALPRFYVYEPFDEKPAHAGNGAMIAFLAPSQEAVDHAYEAGLKQGGICAGRPGPRPHYGNGYYGAYLHDLDKNKIHITYRGDLK